MPKKEKLPHRIDETVAEIAAILARGDSWGRPTHFKKISLLRT